MQPLIDALVYVVDDDASVRDALAWLLRSRRLPSEVFESAEAFQHQLTSGAPPNQPSCLLLDVRMPGMTGLALFDWLIERDLHLGTFDFCEKPFSDNALVDRVDRALAQSQAYSLARRKTALLQARQARVFDKMEVKSAVELVNLLRTRP